MSTADEEENVASIQKWFGIVSGGWDEMVARSVGIGLIGFPTLCLKDGIESGDWGDWVSPLTDAVAIAAAIFLLSALVKLLEK
jgi:hypothetical protein